MRRWWRISGSGALGLLTNIRTSPLRPSQTPGTADCFALLDQEKHDVLIWYERAGPYHLLGEMRREQGEWQTQQATLLGEAQEEGCRLHPMPQGSRSPDGRWMQTPYSLINASKPWCSGLVVMLYFHCLYELFLDLDFNYERQTAS